MGAAQSADQVPTPREFEPEEGEAAAGPSGLISVWQSPFGCDSAARGCCEKKSTVGGDIRIAHNRPVLSKVCVCGGGSCVSASRLPARVQFVPTRGTGRG